MSEQTDAAIVVVSEEKGEISFVHNGNIYRNVTPQDLETRITAYLAKEQ
jgi:DNA integrity scanning protein DisA with diadenylate cyclase activity